MSDTTAQATGQAGYADAEAFLADVRSQYEELSGQLKKIARHVEKTREQITLEGVQETARQCGVQPSAIVRFAKHFGFSGYSEMQALFRARAVRRLAFDRAYEERVRKLVGPGGNEQSPARIAHEVIGGCIASLQTLQRNLQAAQFDAAVALMLETPALWLVATRRAFPVGAYLNYALQYTGKPVHWLDGIGHMQLGQLRALKPGDVMIAISFEPYAPETVEAVRAAHERGAKVIAITDSQLSPLAACAKVTLLTQDGVTFGFRSLTSTHSLAQSLFLGLAYRMELAHDHGLEGETER
jgi:DNA-binding MurR/RpiR family transcriptional regulator